MSEKIGVWDTEEDSERDHLWRGSCVADFYIFFHILYIYIIVSFSFLYAFIDTSSQQIVRAVAAPALSNLQQPKLQCNKHIYSLPQPLTSGVITGLLRLHIIVMNHPCLYVYEHKL